MDYKGVHPPGGPADTPEKLVTWLMLEGLDAYQDRSGHLPVAIALHVRDFDTARAVLHGRLPRAVIETKKFGGPQPGTAWLGPA